MKSVALALVALAIGASVPLLEVASAPVEAQSWYDGACTDADGVTVIVDFQELGGGVNVRCATGSVDSGLDALSQAGIAWEGTRRFPGFVCRIAGRPGPDTEPCGNTPPASAYWSYWVAARGGAWCYSSRGAADRTPTPGGVEGWSFALDRATSEIPPPRVDPPAPVPGAPAAPLAPGDCTTSDSSATTTSVPPSSAPPATTTRPTATVSPATTVPAADPPSPTPAPATTAAPAIDAPGRAEIVTTTAAPVDSSTTTSVAGLPPTTLSGAAAGGVDAGGADAARPDRPGSDGPSGALVDDASGAGVVDGAGAAAPPIGAVDLSDDGRGDGGSAAATLLGVLAIAAVAGAGFWAARRRQGVA